MSEIEMGKMIETVAISTAAIGFAMCLWATAIIITIHDCRRRICDTLNFRAGELLDEMEALHALFRRDSTGN